MTDPYKVLGIPTTATDDEVKAAYRRLAKKYHPDANPGDKAAEQRMKEINAAYDQIMNKNASSEPFGSGYDPFGGAYSAYGGAGAQGGDPKMQAAYNYLAYGRYREALNVLSSIQQRDARWYYYSAAANHGLGNTAAALEHARKAVNMEPDNIEYAEFLERLQNGGAYYSPFGGFGDFGGFGGSRRVYNCSSGSGRLCLGALAMQLFCLYSRFCCR